MLLLKFPVLDDEVLGVGSGCKGCARYAWLLEMRGMACS